MFQKLHTNFFHSNYINLGINAINSSAIAKAAKKTKSISKQISRIAARQYQRKQLSKLDNRQLNDIGLTREQAETEANKYFWQ